MPTLPFVTVRGLWIRFGGLTAVNRVDLDIQRGSITSIIGPNGAGKTTLFNALSGLVRPSAGEIRIAGRDVRGGWSWQSAVASIAVGVLTAAAAVCIALNPDGLWRAMIRRPTSYSDEPFTLAAAVNGGRDYLAARCAVERQGSGRWSIVSADGRVRLATAENRQTADQLRRQYEQAVQVLPREPAIEQIGGEWLLSPGDLRFPTRDAAVAKRVLLIDMRRRQQARQRMAIASSAIGFFFGGLGVLSVSHRARWTPERAAAAGIARTFQNLRLFRRLTVLENVLVGIEAARPARTAHEPQAMPQSHVPGATDLHEQTTKLLEFVGMADHADRPAGDLAYGEQRRLEIARALAVRPGLLLLDEPAAGMNATETMRLVELIRQIRSAGVTVVLIEHEMDLVMSMSDHVVVLDAGKKIASGPPELIRHDPAVIEAYLG